LEANPGDTITITWRLNGFGGGLPQDLELAVQAPDGFQPLGRESRFDPALHRLTLPLTGTEGSQAWYIGPLAQPPYVLHGELLLAGEVLAADDFSLTRRGPAAAHPAKDLAEKVGKGAAAAK